MFSRPLRRSGFLYNGNIIAKYEYALTVTPTKELHLLDCTCINYAYDDNSDQLISYGDETFVYDVIGNPTTYRGKSATWEHGRRLTNFDGNTFSYDARGRRTGKNDISFTYDSNGNLIRQSNGLEFLYDHTGVFAVKYNGSTYFYRKDAQANIVALLDNTGAVVVEYTYDAWGKCLTTILDEASATLAELNPFRYRSYYYDTETNLYFLKTRYYDPEIGRFMTIDDISYLDPESINGLNLYAYCLDNPVMGYDPNGTFVFTTAIVVGLIAGAIIGGTIGGVYAYNQAVATGATGWDLFGQTVLGVLVGGVIGAAIGGLIGAAAPYIGAFLSSSFPIFAPVMMDGAIGVAVIGTVTGAQVAGGAIAVGAGLVLFAKGSGPRMGHNQHEKQMWEEAKRQRNIKDKDLARRIHDRLKKYPYAETLDELLDVIDDILSQLGKK